MRLEVPEDALFGDEEGEAHGEQLPALHEHGVVRVLLGVRQIHERVRRRRWTGIAGEPLTTAQQQILKQGTNI